MSDPVFRIACLGAGYFSAFHFDGWRRIEQSALVAIADQDISKARIQDVSAHSDLGTMLTHAKADILDIITPPSTHLAAIRDAVKFQLLTNFS